LNFNYTFHWYQAFRALPDMLAGALVTLEIALLSMLLGVTLAVLLALARNSRFAALRMVAWTWVEVARNTPALFQIYMAYFGLASVGVMLDSYLAPLGIGPLRLRLDSYPALLAGIAFNNAGYLAETFRGGLRAIPATQTRAARSLGMGPAQAFVYVVLPQLFRIVFHPMTNQMVWAILMTSLGVVVGLNTDLTGITQELNVRTFRTFEFFAIAAVLYYLIAKAVTLSARLAAWRLFRY
jgi:polar amino acid transport system permease protein